MAWKIKTLWDLVKIKEWKMSKVARIENVVIRTMSGGDAGSEIKSIAEAMNLDKGYLAKILREDGRFKTSICLVDGRAQEKKQAQVFLDLFFAGKIDPASGEILFALSYVPYKKNISKLFEIERYGYSLVGDISTIFSMTRALEGKRKLALMMLLNFNKSDIVDRYVIEDKSEEIKSVLTVDDMDWLMIERMRVKRDVIDKDSKFLSERLEYKNREKRLYTYLIKEGAVERRDPLLGRLILNTENLKDRVKEIPLEYWIHTPISLDVMREKAAIELDKGQLESRLQYLLKLPNEFYYVNEIAKALDRKITSQELDIHIKNNPGRVIRVDDKDEVNFTDDQFIEIMASWSRFAKPLSLRWFWDNYSLEHNETLKRIYKERPGDVKDAWEAILEALFESDFRDEVSVINGLLKDIGRSMTEKEKKSYSKKVFGL